MVVRTKAYPAYPGRMALAAKRTHVEICSSEDMYISWDAGVIRMRKARSSHTYDRVFDKFVICCHSPVAGRLPHMDDLRQYRTAADTDPHCDSSCKNVFAAVAIGENTGRGSCPVAADTE